MKGKKRRVFFTDVRASRKYLFSFTSFVILSDTLISLVTLVVICRFIRKISGPTERERKHRQTDYIEILNEDKDRGKNRLNETSPRYLISSESESDNSDRDFIARLERVMKRNAGNSDYSIDDLCQDMHLERSGLYKHFKKSVGMTPLKYIRSKQEEYYQEYPEDV